MGCKIVSLVDADLDTMIWMCFVVCSGGVKMDAWVWVQVMDDLPCVNDAVAFTSPL